MTVAHRCLSLLRQLSVQTLIAESRARQLEEAQSREEEQALKADKLRSSVRVLWGLMQEMQMRLRDQQESVAAGNEVHARARFACIFSHRPVSHAGVCACVRVCVHHRRVPFSLPGSSSRRSQSCSPILAGRTASKGARARSEVNDVWDSCHIDSLRAARELWHGSGCGWYK